MDDALTRWLSSQVDAFGRLIGHTVIGWTGVEMALLEESPTGLVFSLPDLPFLQFLQLEIELEGGDRRIVSTHQEGDDGWGLHIEQGPMLRTMWDGIYRLRAPVLPIGQVLAVEPRIEEDLLSEVLVRIRAEDLLLVAGELYETWSGVHEIHRFDESVLVFAAPTDAASVDWIPPRRPNNRASGEA